MPLVRGRILAGVSERRRVQDVRVLGYELQDWEDGG